MRSTSFVPARIPISSKTDARGNVLDAVCIDVAQGDVEEARKRIDGLDRVHPFDARYARVENLDWESCAKVILAEDKQRALGTGW